MLYGIRCNLMQPLNGALPGQYVPVRVKRGALVTHRYTYAPPRCRTSQYSRTFIPPSVSFWNIITQKLLTPYSMVWDWWVSREGQCFFIGLSCSIPTIIFYSFFLSLLPVYRLVLSRRAGVFALIGRRSLSQTCTANLF